MKVHFVPLYKGNPYQTRLKESLETRGVLVSSSKTFWKFRSRGLEPGELLHLHWPPRLSNGVRRYFQALKIVAALRKVARKGHAIVWTVHNLRDHETSDVRLERWLYRQILKCSTVAIVHTESARREVGVHLGTEHLEKIKVIPHANYLDAYPNSIDREEARLRLGLSSETTVFLFFGFIRPYKNVGMLISAFLNFLETHQGSCLIVAGRPWSPELEADLRGTAEGREGVLLHLDYTKDDEVQVLMNAADAVVFPYHDTLTSGAVVLAMSFAKACLVPESGAFSEVLAPGGAIEYSPGRKQGLQDALREASRRVDELTAMGERNLDHVGGQTWDVVAEKTLELYRSCSRARSHGKG